MFFGFHITNQDEVILNFQNNNFQNCNILKYLIKFILEYLI